MWRSRASAAAASTKPVPASAGVAPSIACAVLTIADRTSFARVASDRERSAIDPMSSAQIPATCGVAIDVPLIRTYRGGTAHGSRASTAARARDPGAVRARGARGDAAADRNDVGLAIANAGDRPARTVRGDPAVLVGGADGERAAGVARRADGPRRRSRVARGDADEDARGRERIDLAGERRARRAWSAERQVHHLDVLGARPRHAGEDRVLGPTVSAQHLRDDERRRRGDAPVHRTSARGDPRDVGAVTDVVALRGPRVIRMRDDPIAQIGVHRIDAGIHDRDPHALAAQSGVPQRRDMKERDAVIEQRLDLVRRTSGDPDQVQRRHEGLLPVGRHIEDDDVGALMGLTHRCAEARQERSRDPGRRGMRARGLRVGLG